MRARLAIAVAQQNVELREVVLKHKPAALIAVSPKATVPVLVLEDQIIDESIDIMLWALQRRDPDNWLAGCPEGPQRHPLVFANDQRFKPILDKYKYFDRHPEQSQEFYLQQALPYLQSLEEALEKNEGYLAASNFSFVDAALFPFIRQFANCDVAKFEALELSRLSDWLERCLNSDLFMSIMKKFPQWSPELNNGIEFPD